MLGSQRGLVGKSEEEAVAAYVFPDGDPYILVAIVVTQSDVYILDQYLIVEIAV